MDCSLSHFLAIFELHKLLLPGFGPSGLWDYLRSFVAGQGAGVRGADAEDVQAIYRARRNRPNKSTSRLGNKSQKQKRVNISDIQVLPEYEFILEAVKGCPG